MSRFVDLSHPIVAGMTTYPGLPAPEITTYTGREESARRLAGGVSFHVGRIGMVANTGTYLDAPFHFHADGADVSAVPLERIAEVPIVMIRASRLPSVDARHLGDPAAYGGVAMTARGEPPYYWDYLQLDQLLGCQRLVSARRGAPAHDELLFIIVHQAFELWFKQILFELDTVLAVMGADIVPEKEMGQVVARLGRITTIQRLLLDQIDVLETMTPLDFLDFRDELIPASGFQSVQFRLIENRLGLRPPHRLAIKGSPYLRVLSDEHARWVEASQQQPSLLDHVERWLQRTPFLHFGDYDFWRSYQQAVEGMLTGERHVIEGHPNLDDQGRAEQLATLDQTVTNFAAVFDRERYAELVTRGKRRLSHRAFLAALLINLYRDEPIFQLPFRLLTALVDIDEGFTAWRYRHALLAHRMIGARIGTGGTAGHAYLEAAARKHRVFRDLFDLPTFFIPRSALPTLPPEVTEQMGFRYQGER